ncbi:MAG: MerC domain-containing protein [Patescibacteria group bacterium]
MDTNQIRYEINKLNNRVSLFLDAIIPCLFLLLVLTVSTIVFFGNYSSDNRLAVLLMFVTSVPVLVLFISIRLWPWKKPFQVVIKDDGNVNVRYPSGRERNFSLQDVSRIGIENRQNYEIVRKVTPIVFLEKYSINAMMWSIYMGAFWAKSDVVFLHFYLNNKKFFLLPVMRADTDSVINRISQINPNLSSNQGTLQDSLLPKWLSRLVKVSAVILMVMVPVFGIFMAATGSKFTNDAQFLLIFMLGLLAFMVICASMSVLMFVLGWRGIKHRSTIFSGMVVEGGSAVVLGLIWHIAGLFFAAIFIGSFVVEVIFFRELVKEISTPSPTEISNTLGSSPNQSMETSFGLNSQFVVNTEGWQAYQNSEYGFSLFYPVGWKINDQSYTDQGVKIAGLEIESPIRYDLPGFEGLGSVYSAQYSFDRGWATIDHQGFIKAYSAGDQAVTDIPLPNDQLKNYPEYRLEQHTFNTINFIKGWSNYSNDPYRFAVKHPDGLIPKDLTNSEKKGELLHIGLLYPSNITEIDTEIWVTSGTADDATKIISILGESFEKVSEEKIWIDNKPGKKILMKNKNVSDFCEAYVLEYYGTTYSVTSCGLEMSTRIFDGIASTFQFIMY